MVDSIELFGVFKKKKWSACGDQLVMYAVVLHGVTSHLRGHGQDGCLQILSHFLGGEVPTEAGRHQREDAPVFP